MKNVLAIIIVLLEVGAFSTIGISGEIGLKTFNTEETDVEVPTLA